MIRVIIVDDHPVVHDGVRSALSRTPDIRLVDAAGTIPQALVALEKHHPDAVLLDIRLQGADGLSSIAELLRARPSLKIIIFSAYDLDDYVFGAIRAGARGYVLKGSPAAEMIDAIRKVIAGGSYLSPSLSTKIVDSIQTRSRGSRLLTPRELTVLRLVAAGLPNRAIAESLAITERTVKFHVTALFNKLGADNRAQAVALAGRRGILPPDQG
jgi:DNA-binding NarL/FixJ family response regulator